jgi:hypothetical protein
MRGGGGAEAAVAVGGASQVRVALVEGFDVDGQHGGAPWLEGLGRAAMVAAGQGFPSMLTEHRASL